MNVVIQALGWGAAITIVVLFVVYLMERTALHYQLRRRQLRREILKLERQRDALKIGIALSTDKG